VIVRLATFAMGTRFEIVVAGDDEAALRGAGEAAVAEIEEWDRRLSLFRPDSLVSHVNRTAHERPVRLDRDTFDLLVLAKEVWRDSGGALDITMGAVMKQLGFHADGSSATSTADRRPWGMDAVVLDPGTLGVSFGRPGLALDLGALAKGHAIDLALIILREQGVRTALIHGGTSSVGAIGAPDDQPHGWRIALGPDGSGAPVVQLRDASLSVSGRHGRTIERDGERLGHVLDPRTGIPAHGADVACVVGPLGRVAEAWSTALLVLDARPGLMPHAYVSLLRTGDAPWRIDGDGTDRVVVADR
jgi:thiamine biosynthesis lipoprotein